MSSIVSTHKLDVSKTEDMFKMLESIRTVQKAKLKFIIDDLSDGKKDGHWIWFPFTTDLAGNADPYKLRLPKKPNSLLAFALFTENDAFYEIMNRIIECIEKSSFVEVFQNEVDQGRIRFWIEYWTQVISDCKGTQFHDTFNRFVKALNKPPASESYNSFASKSASEPPTSNPFAGKKNRFNEWDVAIKSTMDSISNKVAAEHYVKKFWKLESYQNLQPSTKKMLPLIVFHENLFGDFTKDDIIKIIKKFPGRIAVTSKPSLTDPLKLHCSPDDMMLLVSNPCSGWLNFLQVFTDACIKHGFKTMVPNNYHQGRFEFFVKDWMSFAEKYNHKHLLEIVYHIARSMCAGGVKCCVDNEKLSSMFLNDTTHYHN